MHKQYLTSAPAKVILFGEHAVVHSKKSIATTLSKRTYCLIEHSSTLEIVCPDINVDYKSGDEISNPAVEAFIKLCELIGVSGAKVLVRSEVPVGAGLGSSASFTVSLATALLLHSNKTTLDLNLDLINHFGFEGEKIIHGNPSGVDNTIVTYGGGMIYQKPNTFTGIPGFGGLRFLVTDTKVPKNTKKQVEMFNQRLEEYPGIMQCVIDAIHKISEDCVDVFQSYSQSQSQSSTSMSISTLYQRIQVCFFN